MVTCNSRSLLSFKKKTTTKKTALTVLWWTRLSMCLPSCSKALTWETGDALSAQMQNKSTRGKILIYIKHIWFCWFAQVCTANAPVAKGVSCCICVFIFNRKHKKKKAMNIALGLKTRQCWQIVTTTCKIQCAKCSQAEVDIDGSVGKFHCC